MIARTLLVGGSGSLLSLLLLGAMTPASFGQTPLPGGFEISLLPGFTYEPKQGFDSIVGEIAKKDGLKIQFEMGRIPAGGLRLGGDFVNQALHLPEKDRQWLKEQTAAGGRKIHVAYSKEQLLIVTTASKTEGVNFTAVAKSPGDVAEVLLMVLTLAEKKPKADK